MKKLAVILIALMSTGLFAQHREQRHAGADFSPEQQATLKTKRMALDLELTDSQQNQVMALNKKYAEMRKANQAKMQAERTAGKQLTSEEKFKLQNASLDQQIAYKNELKKILNQSQFDKWQENRDCKMHKGFDKQSKGDAKGLKTEKGQKS